MTRRQLRTNRFLPEYVTRFKDRHGKDRLRFRRKGFPSYYFKATLGTEAFREEYAACMDPEAPARAARASAEGRSAPGSLGDLLFRYCAVPTRLGPTKVTQDKVRAVLEKFTIGRESRPVAAVTFEHLDAIIARKREKSVNPETGRIEGGIDAAKKLRKELVRLFDFAVKLGFRRDNPATQAERVKVSPAERSTGFHTWTEQEISQYRAKHPIGSRARLAMELLLWTGMRRSEGVWLGRQHIRDGRIRIEQGKTGKSGWIAVAPQLLEAIVAMPPTSSMCFLTTDFGRPYSKAGFGNKFREWCDDAGLPHCSAHGLRKAIMRRMAELDMGNQTMKSVSLHSKDDEVARYTASANQIRMADDAIGRLARWETSNPSPGLDTKEAKNG